MYVFSAFSWEHQPVMYSLSLTPPCWLNAASCYWIHGQNGNCEVSLMCCCILFPAELEFISFYCYYLLQVKLWDLSNNQPSCVASKTPKAVSFLLLFLQICLMEKYSLIWIMMTLLTLITSILMVLYRELYFLFLSQRTTPSCWL